MKHLLQLGFRPFYLLAALFGIIAVSSWLLVVTGRAEANSYLGNTFWHSHEMVFGFLVAVMTGFLFTAVRNWTGLPTPTGLPLAAIALLWLLARVAFFLDLWQFGVIVDLLFLPVVTVAIAVPVFRSANRRNYKIVALIAALSCLHGLFHLAPDDGSFAWLSRQSLFAAIDVVAILFALVGGRIIPAFTRNAVKDANPVTVELVEVLVFGTLLLIAGLTLTGGWAMLPAWVASMLLLLAAASHLVRLVLWQPLKTFGNPLLLMLPVSYAWFPVALLLRELSFRAVVSPGVWIHALTAGALSSMMLAMMIRSSLGHTGRTLVASRVDMLAFIVLQAAAILRVLAEGSVAYTPFMVASGVAWVVAFSLFALRFLPILCGPRIDATSN